MSSSKMTEMVEKPNSEALRTVLTPGTPSRAEVSG